MPDFQKEALFLSESFTSKAVPPPLRRMERLRRAFGASFLHYTKKAPGRWTHPRANWTGTPDRPSCGCCICLAVLASGSDPEEWCVRYLEFIGAAAGHLTPEDAAFVLLILPLCARLHPEDPRFAALEAYLKTKQRPPETEVWRRACRIAEKLRGTDGIG